MSFVTLPLTANDPQDPTSGPFNWTLSDHQGSVRDIVKSDAITATPQHLNYDSFGNITTPGFGQEQSIAVENPSFEDSILTPEWVFSKTGVTGSATSVGDDAAPPDGSRVLLIRAGFDFESNPASSRVTQTISESIAPNTTYTLKVWTKRPATSAVLLKSGSDVLVGEQYTDGTTSWEERIVSWTSGPAGSPHVGQPLSIALVSGIAQDLSDGEGAATDGNSASSGNDERTDVDDTSEGGPDAEINFADGARFDHVRLTKTTQGSTPRFLHQGVHYLPESGLYDHGARMRDPRTNVFISEDPAPLKGDDRRNLYVFVGNHPVNKRDPTGTSAVENNSHTAQPRAGTVPAWTAPASWGQPTGVGNVKLRMYRGTNPDGSVRLSYRWSRQVADDYHEGLTQYEITLPARTPQATIDRMRSIASGMANDYGQLSAQQDLVRSLERHRLLH